MRPGRNIEYTDSRAGCQRVVPARPRPKGLVMFVHAWTKGITMAGFDQTRRRNGQGVTKVRPWRRCQHSVDARAVHVAGRAPGMRNDIEHKQGVLQRISRVIRTPCQTALQVGQAPEQPSWTWRAEDRVTTDVLQFAQNCERTSKIIVEQSHLGLHKRCVPH